ncbi:MAG: F0F1 ATP synthase subunit B [Clostridia bacterium]|nr:F0F1 ATP synthase subunit B [Clostridia bacterium]
MEWFLNEFETFVGVNFWTMLFAWCNLLILYIFLKKFLFKPIKKMIDSRQAEIDGMYSDAEGKRAEADAMRAEYEARLSEAKEESEEILKSARRRAALKEEEILNDAKAEAARVLERADEEIELERKRILNEVKDEVSGLAVGIASAVIGRDVTEEEHHELIDTFIDEVGEKK